MWDTRSAYLTNYDGDTVTYESDLGRHIRHEADVRLLGVFAPELRQPGGAECRQFVRSWHETRVRGRRWPFLVVTALVWAGDPDRAEAKKTLDRYVATVTCIETNEVLNLAVAEFIRANGYTGGTGS